MTPENRNTTCLVDLDGTLADYEGQMARDLERLRSPAEEKWEFSFGRENPEWLENRMDLIKSSPNWWRNLSVLDDGMELLGMAAKIGFQPHILTKGPFRTTTAWEQKVIWVREKIDPVLSFRGVTTHITITQDKSLVYGRILIDDWPDYVMPWLKKRPRGLVVMPKRSYNQDIVHPQIVIYDMKDQASVELTQARMQEAFYR